MSHINVCTVYEWYWLISKCLEASDFKSLYKSVWYKYYLQNCMLKVLNCKKNTFSEWLHSTAAVALKSKVILHFVKKQKISFSQFRAFIWKTLPPFFLSSIPINKNCNEKRLKTLHSGTADVACVPGLGKTTKTVAAAAAPILLNSGKTKVLPIFPLQHCYYRMLTC